MGKFRRQSWLAYALLLVSACDGGGGQSRGAGTTDAGPGADARGGGGNATDVGRGGSGGGGGGGGSAGAGGGSAGGGGEPPRPDGGMPAKDAGGPLPAALTPVVRFDGCRGYSCELVVPQGMTAAYAWHLDGAVLPDRRADGAPIDRHAQVLDTAFLDTRGALTCSARLADARGLFGPAATSEPMTFAPLRPSVAEVVLSPREPAPTDELHCQPAGARYGACADVPTFEYRWTADDVELPRANTDHLQAALPVGTVVRCHARPLGLGVSGDEVASNDVTMPAVARGVPNVRAEFTDDPDHPVRCAFVQDMGNAPGVTWWWQINDRAAFPASAALTADQVSSCDRLRCWAVLPTGVRTLRAEVQAPLGEGCPAADDCGSPACHPAGGCARTLLGGGECVVGGCAVDGRCDAGRCVARIDPCDDHEPCTLDTCDAEGGCAHTPADAVPCDDGDPCTEGDRCNAGSCGGRRTCGGCRADADCDDANPCTVDRCSAAECAYAPGEGECSDGDACTENDACVDGLCRGTAVDCEERFVDADGDGYGVTPPEGSAQLCACDAELRPTAARGGDCDDADPALHPDAVDLPDDGIDTDCDGQEQFGEATVSIGTPGGGGAGGGGGDTPPPAPDAPAPITGDFDFGPVLGDHPAEGEVTRSADGASWCVSAAIHQAFDQILTLDGATVETCQGPDGVRHSTVRGAARIAGIPVTVNGSIDLGEVLDYELDITGNVSFQGASAPALAGGSFASRRNGAIQWGIRATLQGLTFAPGFSLGQTELSFGPVGEDALPGLSLSSILNLGQAPTGLSLAVNGILTLDGAGDLSLSLAPGTRWQPFGPRVPLGTFEALSGGLHLAADGTVSADFDLGLANELVLVRGALALTDASVSGSVDQNGAFEVSLSGTTEITVGAAEPVSVRVVGTLENGDVLSLTGEIDGPVEPLAAIAGDDALILEGTDLRPFLVGLTLDLTDRTLSVSVDVPATMTLLPGPDAIELTTFVHGEATIGAAAPQWLFQAIVDEITLPVLGTLPSVAVIAATDDTAEVDLFRNGEIVRDVPGGITLAVQGDAPFSLPGLDSVLFILQVARNGRLSIEADLGISAMFIRPDDDVPGVESMELTRLALTGSIQGARVTLSIESNVELQPDNQDEPLQGFTSLQFSPATQEFGGTIALTGRWTEPMSLRNFAFQNPAFTMAFRINLETGIPTVVITRLGWNLDIFWKKSGDWPVDGLDPDSESTPENVLKVGNTFLFDMTPTPSGLCVIGACLPLPPMAVRFDLRNLTSDDLITVINDIVQGLVGFFGDAVPEGDLPALDLEPFSLAVRTMRFQASTHTMDFYGQPLVAGIFATLDATLNRVDALFEGHLSPDGLLLHGETDAIWLPHIELSGDPFQRELRDAAPRTMSTRDLTFNPGGFEAFVGVSDCNQERRIFGPTAGDGVSLSLGACDAAGKMPLAARIMTGGQTRTVTTEATIPRDGLAHHVALQISGRDVAMYADSDRLVVASDSAPDIAPGTISVATIGAPGITTLDDIRFWNGATRSTAEIVSQARVLPTRYMNPNGSFAASPLMRRYEFDFDTGPGSARNAREGLRSPYPLTGAGGRLEAPAANPLRFLLDVPSPLAGAPRLPSFGIDAGMSLYLPFLPDPSIKVAVEAKLGDQGNRFRFRTNPIGFLPIPGPDGLLGTFYVTGRGRNLVDDGGGYDDGLYGEIDLESLYLSGSASLEWHDADGSVTRFIEGTMAFDQATEYFSLDTSIDWTVPLGDLGDIGVSGRAAFNPDPLPAGGSPENKLLISGDVILFDESFAGVEVAIDGTQMSFEADWRGSAPPGLGIDGATLAAASVKYVVDFVNSTACGNATVQVGAGTCQIQLCFEPFPAAPTVTGSCSLDCGDDVCGLGDPLGTRLGLVGVETCGRDDGGSRCNSDCDKCLLAGPCTADADCASNNCWGNICVTSVYCGDTTCGLVGIPLLEEHCGYRREDNGCQEDCGLCQIGDTCTHDRDCVTGRCSGGLIKTCEPRCGDGVCTAAREFCGANDSGSVCRTDCGQCGNGTPCVSDAVCRSGYCAAVCAEDPCGRNGCEWIPGIEWCGAGNGGPECQRDCDLCEGGMTCNGNSDCQTGSCVAGLCTYCGDGQCEDNILTEYCGSGVNGTTCETDCNLCQNGHVCDADADCDSGYCLLGVCTESPCGRNGCEWIPGIEWCGSGNGGPECERDCGLCNTGDTCDGDADCETNNCIGFVCGPERRNCGDGRCVNIVGIEVCGGSDEISPLGYADCERDCGTCGMGEPCDRDNDCDEGECLNAFEGAPGLCAGCGDGQCTWPIENCGSGNGGGVCQSDCGKCGLAGFCDSNSDCRSGSCAGFICLPSCGDGSCSDGETCGASDLHCRADCGLCGDGTWCARDRDCVNWCRVSWDGLRCAE